MIKRYDLKHLAQGFLMGGADIIPGVSGGTVALILRIYERLVSATITADVVPPQIVHQDDDDIRTYTRLLIIGIQGTAANANGDEHPPKTSSHSTIK